MNESPTMIRSAVQPTRAMPDITIEAAARRTGAVDPFTWAALAIVLIGAVMRLYTIFAFTWDQDELYTRMEARDLFHTTLPPGIDARPLYYLLQHPLLSLLPQTVPMLRLLPFVFGVAGLWVTWLAGRRNLGRVGGLVAVFLASMSTWHMEVSGQARYYSLVYLFAALVLLWLPQAYDSERPSLYLASFAAMMLGSLTHPSFAFPIAGLAIAIMFVRRSGKVNWTWPSDAAWKYLWGPFVAFVVAFLTILKLVHRQSAFHNWDGRGLVSTLRLIPAMVEWMTPAVFGAAVVGALCLLASRGPGARRLGAICLLSFAVTFGALFAASFWTSIYAVYATALLPVVFVAAGSVAQLAADAGDGWLRESTVATVAMALFGFAIAPVTVSHLSDGTRFDYRPAYRQIEREAPTIPVLTWPGDLAQEYAPGLKLLPLLPDRAYMDRMLARYHDVWVVASVKRTGIALDDAGELDAWLAAHCRREAAFERPRFDYRIYRVELHRCIAPANGDAVTTPHHAQGL